MLKSRRQNFGRVRVYADELTVQTEAVDQTRAKRTTLGTQNFLGFSLNVNKSERRPTSIKLARTPSNAT